MKRLIAALMMASALAGLIGGCSVPPDEAGIAEDSDSINGTLEKAEQVEFRSGSGEVLRTLTTNDELNAFFETIDLGDDWEWVDEPEEEPVTELTAAFLQTPTQTVFGKKVEAGTVYLPRGAARRNGAGTARNGGGLKMMSHIHLNVAG